MCNGGKGMQNQRSGGEEEYQGKVAGEQWKSGGAPAAQWSDKPTWWRLAGTCEDQPARTAGTLSIPQDHLFLLARASSLSRLSCCFRGTRPCSSSGERGPWSSRTSGRCQRQTASRRGRMQACKRWSQARERASVRGTSDTPRFSSAQATADTTSACSSAAASWNPSCNAVQMQTSLPVNHARW